MSKAIQRQERLFDYDALDAESRILIQQRAGEIKTLAKRVAGDIVEIGGKLAEVKERLGGNGRFNDWLTVELGWSERTAYNFIAVHAKFGAANFAIENVAPSALYLLVAPTTPEPARQTAIEMANQGEKVSHKTAKAIVESAKEAEPKTAEMFEEPELPEEEPQQAEDAGNSITAPTPTVTEAQSAKPVKPSKPSKPDMATVIKSGVQTQKFWSQTQIVIGVTLMPHDGDARGRQAIVSIRAGDGSPTIQSKRLHDLPGEWPAPIDEMISAFALAEAKPKPKSVAKKTAKKGKK